MNSTPIYIQSLELENIRTFGPKVDLRLEKENGTIPQWTLILGDNGIGKSTLVQCIAWMKPYLPYKIDDVESGDFSPAPSISDEENETLERLVKRNRGGENIDTAKIDVRFIAKRKLNTKYASKNLSDCHTGMTIGLNNEGSLSSFKPILETEYKEIFHREEVLIYAYSASRNIGKLNLGDPELEDTIPSFIDEETVLYDAEEIFHTLKYAALAVKGKLKEEHEKYIEKIQRMLISILPDVGKIADMEILAPKLPRKNQELDIRKGFVITTKHGKKIPFDEMSLGYKTTISWTVDLAWRLYLQYPESDNPLAEPAIVLVDEIDLHLHPKWQRQIMANLSKHFKKTQFIATAHSPLMVQEAIKSNYAVLKQDVNGVDILNDPQGIDGWRVDQILTSELFGLRSSHSTEYEYISDKRDVLIRKKKLTAKEKNDLESIRLKLSRLPSGETPEEIENRQLISKIAADIRKKGTKIKL